MHIDLEAQSHHRWKKFVRSLSSNDASMLAIWRSGTSWSPTRRYGLRPALAHLCYCQYCAAPLASTRHYWALCPHFESQRRSLQRKHNIGESFWTEAPRVLAKTAWVTVDCAQTLTRRVTLQIVAATLAIEILKEGGGPQDRHSPLQNLDH